MFREPLLQSSLWQTLQEKNGCTCLFGDFGLAVVETLPIVGSYLYCPRGPIKAIEEALTELLAEAKQEQAGWIRVEPENEIEFGKIKTAVDYKIVEAPHTIQPREILVMDTTPSEEELLAKMKSKTRYNVHLAEKHGVTVRFSRRPEDMETFIDLVYATTERKAIHPHPKRYYRNFLEAFDETACVIALAEHEGKVLAANLLVFFEDTTYYLHGGSSDEARHLMAPYLLQWESIREAKRRGFTQYNFGGVRLQSKEEDDASWDGITRFKQGFVPNTETLLFPGTYDIVIAPWRYKLYRVLQKLQRIRKQWL